MSKCVTKRRWAAVQTQEAEKTIPGCILSLTSRKPSIMQPEAKKKRGKESAAVNAADVFINSAMRLN